MPLLNIKTVYWEAAKISQKWCQLFKRNVAMIYWCQPLKIKVYRTNHLETPSHIVNKAKSVLFLLWVEQICQGAIHFLLVETCPLLFVYFRQHRALKGASSLRCHSAEGRDATRAPQISFQLQQLQDSADKVSAERHAIRKWINNSCISSYLSETASHSTAISNIENAKHFMLAGIISRRCYFMCQQSESV